MIMTNATVVKDPVCGMSVEIATDDGKSEFKGRTYYFCSSNCKEKFDLNPVEYVGMSPGSLKDNDATDGD
jgi:YHS domain-containing protein